LAKGGASDARAKRSGGSVATVTHALKGIGFPARKSDLLDRARKNHAERAVLDIIGAMPDQDYGPWPM
jgi:Protein of unknown function (DUF2795)